MDVKLMMMMITTSFSVLFILNKKLIMFFKYARRGGRTLKSTDTNQEYYDLVFKKLYPTHQT